MSQLRTIRCDVCNLTETEKSPGAGFPGWGALQGIQFDSDIINPELCPAHLAEVAEFTHQLRDKERSK